MIQLRIKNHTVTPNQQIVEVWDGDTLLATVIPTPQTIAVVSKYTDTITEDWAIPPKITINLKRDKTDLF